jgi:hypothetical protein
MALAALPSERRAGKLQGPARDHDAALWRAPVVVFPSRRALFWPSKLAILNGPLSGALIIVGVVFF